MLGHQEITAQADYVFHLNQGPNNWRAKVKIEIDTEKYFIGTADNDSQLQEVLILRDTVFRECFPKLNHSLSSFDHLDHNADFLYVRHKATNKIIATYRLIHSKLSPEFYSSSEFDISEFLDTDGGKLELSRACVDSSQRNGIVLHLLWRGIATYMTSTASRYLFGLTSIQTYDLKVILETYHYLDANGHIGRDLEVQALKPHNLINWYGLSMHKTENTCPQLPDEAPALLRSYLRAGAQVYGAPALDQDFACFDFFTILDFNKLSKAHSKRYFGRKS